MEICLVFGIYHFALVKLQSTNNSKVYHVTVSDDVVKLILETHLLKQSGGTRI